MRKRIFEKFVTVIKECFLLLQFSVYNITTTSTFPLAGMRKFHTVICFRPEKNDIMEAQGKVFIRKERKKRRRLLLWELLYEFSRSTTLHGLRYVTEQGLSIMEK